MCAKVYVNKKGLADTAICNAFNKSLKKKYDKYIYSYPFSMKKITKQRQFLIEIHTKNKKNKSSISHRL